MVNVSDSIRRRTVRRPLAPGSIAVYGLDVWITDQSRPMVLRLGGTSLGELVQWDEPIERRSSPPLLRADAAGCWVVSEHGVVHLRSDGGWSRFEEGASWHAALVDGVLAAAIETGQRNEIGGVTKILLAKPGRARLFTEVPGSVKHLVAGASGCLAVLFLPEDYEGRKGGSDHLRIAEIGLDGTVRVGPVIPDFLGDPPLLAGPEPLVILGRINKLAPLRADLPLGEIREMQSIPMARLDDDRFLLPGGTSSAPTLTMVRRPPWRRSARGGRFIPLATTSVPGGAGEVAIDGDGRVWVLGEEWAFRTQLPRRLFVWEPFERDARELDVSSLQPGEVIELTWPEGSEDLDDWLALRVEEFQSDFSEWSTVVSTELIGTYPRNQLVIHFLMGGDKERHGAVAIDLFDLDGLPNDELYNVTWLLFEQLQFSGLGDLAPVRRPGRGRLAAGALTLT
jgi:hypothetical protein